MSPPLDLCGLTLPELEKLMAERFGQPAYRAKQLYVWVHQRGETDFQKMTDLSLSLRAELAATTTATPLVKDVEQRSSDGTIKYRFKTSDGKLIESV